MVNDYSRYDYAWKTPGWNVQNPVFPVVTDPHSEPGLPSDIAKVRVHGHFRDGSTGRNLQGVLRVRNKKFRTHIPTQTRLSPTNIREKFIGDFEIWLPATDDDDLTPNGVPYEAVLTVAGYTEVFSFLLPTALDSVNILTLLPQSTGGIDIIDITPEGVELGAVPQELVVHLTTGADFRTDLTSDTDWLPDDSVILRIGDLTWTAVISGKTASFSIDKAVANTVPNGTGATLLVVNGGDDAVWAAGKVVRHGVTA